MNSFKLALVSAAVGVTLLFLGVFSTTPAASVTADRPAATAPAGVDSQMSTPAQATPKDLHCSAAETEALSLTPATAAACPSGEAWTCCRCGGCGCRPQRISPTNWCGC